MDDTQDPHKLLQALELLQSQLESARADAQRAKDELARLHGDLSNLLNDAALSVLILDGELNIRRVSPAAQRLLGIRPTDMARPFPGETAALKFPELRARIETVMESLVSQEFETQDDQSVWYRISIRPYKGAQNRVDGVVLCMVDIDSLKRVVHLAQEARADAERGNRARDEFLGVLSHELRTPLASILLHAQMLSRGAIPPEKAGIAIQKIEHNAMLQTQMIDDLLEATRIVSGKFKLDARAFELSSVVLAAAESMRAAAEQRSITLEARVDDSLGEVWGDSTRTRQVVLQLLSNAIKFTPMGGTIKIALETHERHAVLQVADSGAGIDPEFLPHVFDRLVQRESATTRRHGGLGLGLAIVRHVIEALGGRVSATSPGVGRGSTFSVTFPLTGWRSDEFAAERSDVQLVRPLDRPGSRGYDELHGLRVLVLDDDPITLDAVLEVFKLSGAVVRAASSADEALLALEDFVPQVVVSDIAMPESDGYAFIRRLRARGPARGGDTPALALTALSSADDRRRALAAGFQRHVAKPVDIDRLRDAVVDLLHPSPLAH